MRIPSSAWFVPKCVLGMLFLAASLAAQTSETAFFRAVMLPGNEVPPITDLNASGGATVVVHVLRDSSGRILSGSVDFNGTYTFPGDVTLTGLHIHPGAAGVNGPVTINSGLPSTAAAAGPGSITRQAQVASDATTALDTLNGLFRDPSQYYINLHTTVNTGGAMRGQLQRADVVHLLGMMTPANEVPAIPTLNASAIGLVTAVAARDASGVVNNGSVTFRVNYSFAEPPVTLTGLHIHPGPAGVNGPVTLNSGLAQQAADASGNGVLTFTLNVAPESTAALASLAGLFSNPLNYYINLHTTTFTGGAMRAQLRKADLVSFPVTMTPANEVPPISGLNAAGTANVSVGVLRGEDGSVLAGFGVFNVNFRFPDRTEFTGLHIHDGAAGINGPVRINTGLSNTVSETGAGNFYFVTPPQTGPTMLATLNSVVNTPENHYVNLHTTTYTGGAVRAPLGTASSAAPAMAAAMSAVLDRARTTFAPLSLMTIFGTNLSRLTSDMGGGNTLPDNLGGVSVDISGRRARLLYVSPTQINLQVPATATSGSMTVFNGVSTSPPLTVTMAAAAPNLFFTSAGGAVLKNADFSLVGDGNPAQAGDVLLLYSTGLGLTTPPLATGALAPSTPLANTATVTATIGGQSAQVLYSIAAPGFAGLYQTAVRMPTGVAAGNAPVVLSVGSTASNSVNIAVR